MNTLFSPKRFALAFRRLMVEKGIKMFGSILIILFVILLFMNINVTPGTYFNIQSIFLVLGLMFGPVLYMAVIANEFTNQSKGIAYLMLPNSTFEKWLLNNVVVIAIYFIVFSGLFRLLDLWMIGRLEANFDLHNAGIQPIAFDSEIYQIAALVGTGISLAILLGSHYFKKNSLIFTLVILFVGFIIVFIGDHFIANALFDGRVLFGDSAPFGSVYISNIEHNHREVLLESQINPQQTIKYIFIPILAVLSITYFVRLKEKEL